MSQVSSQGTRGWAKYSVGDFSLEAQWDIPPGQVTALFGPSGAGKSTTLRIIAGLVRPQEGHIEIGGNVVFDSEIGATVPAHRRGTGYLTQQFHLFPHLKARANIGYGLTGAKSAGRRLRVQELVRTLRLEGLEDRYPWELSGGQQQRVALARAMAPAPDLLLLDEPFNSLDAELRRELRAELRSMVVESEVPAILVTHDREEALAMADWVQVIDHGKTISEGAPLDVLGQPGRDRVARLVGVENLFDLTVENRNPRDGTMTCAGEGMRLEVPLDLEPVNPEAIPEGAQSLEVSPQRVTVGIRASDIILSGNELRGSSARNRLRGVVTAIEVRPPGYTVVLDCGRPLKCHITGASMAEMDIQTGQELWAVFKASSCFLVQK
jgi:molybdate transport system ATP-binding protein